MAPLACVFAFRSKLYCRRKFPKQLPNVRKHSEMMHDMMCFHDVMPTKEDVAKRYKTMKDEQ